MTAREKAEKLINSVSNYIQLRYTDSVDKHIESIKFCQLICVNIELALIEGRADNVNFYREVYQELDDMLQEAIYYRENN